MGDGEYGLGVGWGVRVHVTSRKSLPQARAGAAGSGRGLWPALPTPPHSGTERKNPEFETGLPGCFESTFVKVGE